MAAPAVRTLSRYLLRQHVAPLGFALAALTALMLVNTMAKQLSRSEEHTSELQSRFDLVCRLLLEKKNQPKSKAGPKNQFILRQERSRKPQSEDSELTSVSLNCTVIHREA